VFSMSLGWARVS